MENLQSSLNIMDEITTKTKNSLKVIVDKKFFAQDEWKRSLKRKEKKLMTELTNKFYFSVRRAISVSSEKGMYYCVIELPILYFERMPYGGPHDLDWDLSFRTEYDTDDLIYKNGLGKPTTVAYKWLRWITKKDNKDLKVIDGIAERNVPYLGYPISYRIIPQNQHLKRYCKGGAWYEKDDNKLRSNILIEFRWDEIKKNKEKYYHSILIDNSVKRNNDHKIEPQNNELLEQYAWETGGDFYEEDGLGTTWDGRPSTTRRTNIEKICDHIPSGYR